ncbi:MAG: nucleotidyltransferase domain-containing protein [Chlamydiota bacterium]|nr:nucleotidyltransferase domain-containing protein [Chlamydiota bacterium]
MLDSLYISKSKIRRDLLVLFFSNPSQKYYLRELERLLGCSAGSIRRELLRFQKDELFFTEKTGNLVYYSLNKKHPFYSELKSIVLKTIGPEGSLKKALSSLGNIQTAFIYGSYASKTDKPSSDIDRMIVGEPNITELYRQLRILEGKHYREINPTIYTVEEYQCKKAQKRGFISDLLSNPKIMLIGKVDDL